jgi:hypothetical protein
MKTTLTKIKQHSPCTEGWAKLLLFLNKTEADDEELLIKTILESNGVKDAIWALRAVEGYDREIRLMACDFAESVVHLANDDRSVNAIAVSRRYANGEATLEELDTARAAAEDAWAAGAAAGAARAAAWAAAWAAAEDAWAAWAAGAAAGAAWAAAGDAAWAAAGDAAGDAGYAELEKQKEILLKYI